MVQLFAEAAYLPTGWARNVLIRTEANGSIAAIEPDSPKAMAGRNGWEVLAGPVLAGMPDVHARPFLRAVAGLAEARSAKDPNAEDDRAWSRAILDTVRQITPEVLEAVTAQLGVELLKGGYTAIGAFQELHNQPTGKAYTDPAEMSRRVIAGAKAAGIGLTLLPALLMTADYGAKQPEPEQRRFATTVDQFATIMGGLVGETRGGGIRLGVAPQALRAVPPGALADIVLRVTQHDVQAPVHIRVAEQRREIDLCTQLAGMRPVEFLLKKMPTGPRWCFVHATHLSEWEVQALARSEVVVGLCPTSAADQGGGLFPTAEFLGHGGRFAIGSDLALDTHAAGELRWLEWTQRLARRKRAVLTTETEPSPGALLWRRAALGGAQALGRPIGALAPGRRADLVVLDGQHPRLLDKVGDAILDTLVFTGPGPLVRDVMVGGHWLVSEGRHVREAEIAAAFRKAIWQLTALA